MTSLILRHSDILPAHTAVRLTRATLTPQRPSPLHGHDFYEVFWVQNGQVRHHLADVKSTLTEGGIVFIQPGQVHGLQGKGDDAMVVSLCIHPDLMAQLVQRHPQFQGHLFWADNGPIQMHRDIRQMAALNQAAMQLERSKCDTLAAEAFLLPLLSDLLPAQTLPDAPDWLKDACLAAREPQVFRNGAAGFVALTGHSHPHVSRAMRRYLAQSPSDYVNGLRMQHAARLLTSDDEPLAAIATDCGIPNLSHFHKVFRAHHGITPLQYRQHYQRNVVQPR